MLGLTLVAAAIVLTLPEPARRKRERWRPQWPRVPSGIRADVTRVSLTAASVWATVAIYLSIVPSYAGDLLDSHDLALLAAVSAVALVASCGAQVASQRLHPPARPAQALGLALLAAGLSGLVVAAPLHSLTLLVAGAVTAGTGHGLGFLNAQDELNRIAPAERRGEVTSAFISCIYVVVAVSVISTGLLDEWLSLAVSVGAVAVALAGAAVALACWQLKMGRSTTLPRGDYRTARGGSTRR